MVQPNGLKEVKGAHSLGQQVEKNERLWLGLLLEGKDCINFLLFSKYCDVNLYMYFTWCGASRMMHNCRGGGM
jgi:hypothetical protein